MQLTGAVNVRLKGAGDGGSDTTTTTTGKVSFPPKARPELTNQWQTTGGRHPPRSQRAAGDTHVSERAKIKASEAFVV